MPKYTFKLRDDDSGVEDDTDVSMPNAEVAYRYACDVVRELMECREQDNRLAADFISPRASNGALVSPRHEFWIERLVPQKWSDRHVPMRTPR
jgi:hypothetical protein